MSSLGIFPSTAIVEVLEYVMAAWYMKLETIVPAKRCMRVYNCYSCSMPDWRSYQALCHCAAT